MSEASGGSTSAHGTIGSGDHTGSNYAGEAVAQFNHSERLSATHAFFEPGADETAARSVNTEPPYSSLKSRSSFVANAGNLQGSQPHQHPSSTTSGLYSEQSIPYLDQSTNSHHVQSDGSLSFNTQPAPWHPYQPFFGLPYGVADARMEERRPSQTYGTEPTAMPSGPVSGQQLTGQSQDSSGIRESAAEYTFASYAPSRTDLPQTSYLGQPYANPLHDPSSVRSGSEHMHSIPTQIPAYAPAPSNAPEPAWQGSAMPPHMGSNPPSSAATSTVKRSSPYVANNQAELPGYSSRHQMQQQYQGPPPDLSIGSSASCAQTDPLNTITATQQFPRYQDYDPQSTLQYDLSGEDYPSQDFIATASKEPGSATHMPAESLDSGSSSHPTSSHHTIGHIAPVFRQPADTPNHENASLVSYPGQALHNREPALADRTFPQYYYASHDPTYALHQYQAPGTAAVNVTPLEYATHHQPSPTWSASPLASPAFFAELPTPVHPRSDYFGGLSSQPGEVRQRSKQSSTPTSLSSVSQNSEQLGGDGTSFLPSASQQRNSQGHHKAGNDGVKGASSSKTKGNAAGAKASTGGAAYVKKETRVMDGTCGSCGTRFATINLRGHPQDFANEFDMIYYCLECAPDKLGVSRASLEASIRLPEDDEAPLYATNVPQEERQSPQGTSELPSGATQTAIKVLARGPRKRIRATDVYSPTVCDVCSRWIAHGSPLPREAGAELAFNVEIVCNLCVDKYRRCSDCGGGGGARLGVGKWRCKELFSPGRKTCSLSHARQSSMASMDYHTTRVRDIPKDEMPQLLENCQAVFESALLSSLAVPEVLERGTAMVSTYEDVLSRMHDGWLEVKRLIEDDIEHESGYRRYIGLRWAKPRPRKITTRKPTQQSEVQEDEQRKSEENTKQVLKPHMNLSGFVTGEWDLHGGTFYITISIPYSTGDHYEGSAQLIGLLQKRVLTERQDMVDELVHQNRSQEAESIRPVLHAFTMLFFTPESKLISYMESKRQMLPLQRYLERYPDTDPKVFPPYRKAYIGSQQSIENWSILVRRVQPPTPIPMPLSRHLSFLGSQYHG